MSETEKPENTGEIVIYQCNKQNVNYHIKNILAEGGLESDRTVKEILTVQTEGTRGVKRSILYYNLEMIIAVGYRVPSPIATRFRQWATARLGSGNTSLKASTSMTSGSRVQTASTPYSLSMVSLS